MNSITRRNFLKVSAGVAAGGASALASGAGILNVNSETKPRPNIIFIMADQLKYSATPFGGNRLLSLPCWQQTAEEGVCFEQAFATSTICTPSRASIMTGTHPQVNRVFCHQNYAPKNLPQLPELLAAAGYHTMGIGHYEVERGLTRGWSQQLGELGNEALKAALASQYQAGSRDVGFSAGEHGLTPEKAHAGLLTDAAIDMLEQRQSGGKPIFLHVSYMEPHPPYFAPKGFGRFVNPDAIQLPPRAGENGRPAWHQKALENFATAKASDDDLRRCIAAYYGMTAYLDTQIARLLAYLKSRGLLENSWVILTSDHGDFAGEKGMFCKSESLYECLLHVPLVIRGPKGSWAPGKHVGGLVELCDLFPTILGIAGAEIPAQNQGHDLIGWVNAGCTTPLREAAFSAVGEYHGYLKTTMPWGLPEAGRHPGLVQGARNHQYAYIRDPDYGDEAYDLEKDPWELNNLLQGGRPAPEPIEQLSARLDEHIHECKALFTQLKVEEGERNFDEPPNSTLTGTTPAK